MILVVLENQRGNIHAFSQEAVVAGQQLSEKLGLDLSNFLIFVAVPFVISAVFFGTKNGYYNSDDYEGDGCAHDVQR